MDVRVLIIPLLTACGGGSTPAIPDAPNPDAPTTPPREVHMSTQSLAAGGEIVEAEMVGGTPGNGDRAIIQLTAPSATLDWNIHAHPAGGVVTIHEELDIMTTTFDFIPSEQADWFLLLRSGTQAIDVQVRVELYGTMTFAFI